MKIVGTFGKEELAWVYLAEFENGKMVEFVESLQPPIPRDEKWVLILSTSFGCPARCLLCDAGGNYQGHLSRQQILEQIDHLILRRYPDRTVPVRKFKIQFARMGEPSLNLDVLDVLQDLPERFRAPGLMPCVSTIAPCGTEKFFERLLDIKNDKYKQGKFQLQFSVHSTDESQRDRLMPLPKWSLSQIARYGARFYRSDDRKITLNFALARGISLDPDIMARIFSPEQFMIKITPVNPTYAAVKNAFQSYVSPYDLDSRYPIVEHLRENGFDTLVSIGENEENLIGSNCGQFVTKYHRNKSTIQKSYSSKYLNITHEQQPVKTP